MSVTGTIHAFTEAFQQFHYSGDNLYTFWLHGGQNTTDPVHVTSEGSPWRQHENYLINGLLVWDEPSLVFENVPTLGRFTWLYMLPFAHAAHWDDAPNMTVVTRQVNTGLIPAGTDVVVTDITLKI